MFVPSLMDDADTGDHGNTRAMVEAEGVRYHFMQADITAAGTPKEVVDHCVEAFGSVDILVNSAGVCPLAEVLDFGRRSGTPPCRST